MDATTTTRVVALGARVAAGVAELEARSINQAETLDLPGVAGCRNTARWLRVTTGVTGRTARTKARLAKCLADLEPTRTATARGEIHAEQAQVIADHMGLLEDEKVSTYDQARAETFLLAEAVGGHDADALATMGHAIWERLDPEGADEREAKALQAQEERARKKTRITMGDDGQGLTHGRFSIPTAAADAFRKQLHALAAPKHVRAEHGAGSYDWQKPSAERMGQAFTDWIETYDPTQLPKIGGLTATVIAIGDYDLLQGKLKAAQLETGTKISPTEYLRLACGAGIIPAWMNASGEVLALGRKHRFHTPAQRLAAIVEQRHCQHHSGCDVPGYLCHAHHTIPWAQGGTTDLRTTTLYCPYHHTRIHQPGHDPTRT
ncbi:HNH endonuclease signature motif containing protein [Nocardioides plantarum]|uniref:HNH endonuclease signature motif containing protein n=1 Tax=Nocardioides plantarum TaxID=29299 RepID=UPI001123ED87|nr:HNH endonuclease signature motif containing protein [Nocardioides plantarum]